MEPTTFNLITGQFPHHGQTYYESREEASRAMLKENPDDVTARNDLAVALLKMGRFEEALSEFEMIQTLAPNRYETHSNRGVLYKKRGDYRSASQAITQALEIKPEGHLGLGDFYLKMLDWMHSTQSGELPERNFLGWAYDEERACQAEDGCLARLEALIRSDRAFSDAMLVLARSLDRRGLSNLSLWAYLRAKQLGHPRTELIDQRIFEIFSYWKEAAGSEFHNKQIVEDQETAQKEILNELERAQSWVQNFEHVEGELIHKLGVVDFSQVEHEMLRRSFHRLEPENIGVRPATWFELVPWFPIAIVFLLLTIIIVIWKKFRKRTRAAQV